MKLDEKNRAIALRKQGKSYGDIIEEVKVSKGTLSIWLRSLVLTEEQKNLLSSRARIQGLKSGEGMRKKWGKLRKDIKDNYQPPINDSQFMLGLGIYWGEGSKYSDADVSIANSDIYIIKIFINWMNDFFHEHFQRFSFCVHHYDHAKDSFVKKYWADKLGLDERCFRKSVFCVSRSSKRKRNTLDYGTLHVVVCGQGVWKIRQKIEKAFEVLK